MGRIRRQVVQARQRVSLRALGRGGRRAIAEGAGAWDLDAGQVGHAEVEHVDGRLIDSAVSAMTDRAAVVHRDGLGDVPRRGDERPNPPTRLARDLLDPTDVGGVGHRDVQVLGAGGLLELDGEDAVLLAEGLRQQLERTVIGVEIGQHDRGQVQRLTDGLQHAALVDETAANELLAQIVGLRQAGADLLDLRALQHAGSNQNLTESKLFAQAASPSTLHRNRTGMKRLSAWRRERAQARVRRRPIAAAIDRAVLGSVRWG